jgi:hypothetical protein
MVFVRSWKTSIVADCLENQDIPCCHLLWNICTPLPWNSCALFPWNICTPLLWNIRAFCGAF